MNHQTQKNIFYKIKETFDQREIDFKQSGQQYNKIFHEYFKKKKNGLIKEIDNLLSEVIIIFFYRESLINRKKL